MDGDQTGLYVTEGILLHGADVNYAVNSRRRIASRRLAETVQRGLEVGVTPSSALGLLRSCCIAATESSPNLNGVP